MMKAAIDIGSNSVRMLIGEVEAGKVEAAAQYLRTTRLGKTEKGGCLNREAVQRTLAALAEFKEILENWQLSDCPVVAATSAVREAADKESFKQQIKDSLGWDLLILPGETEAAMSYRGAVSVAEGASAVIDVGGGSTELIFAAGDKICGRSVAVGAVRLHGGEVEKEQLPEILQPLKALYETAVEPLAMVGVGGTITSLAAMKKQLTVYSREEINGTVILKKELESYYQELSSLSNEEILAKYLLLKNREDIICDGIAIYLALADLLGFSQITVSDAGILDGLLLER